MNMDEIAKTIVASAQAAATKHELRMNEKEQAQARLEHYQEFFVIRDDVFKILIEELTAHPTVRRALQKWHGLNWEDCVEESETLRCCLTEVLEDFPSDPEEETDLVAERSTPP